MKRGSMWGAAVALLAVAGIILTGCPGNENVAPTIDAGADQVVEIGEDVTLTGTAADANGDAMTYEWTLTGRPGGSSLTEDSITNPTALEATFTPDVEGEYVATLTVSDGIETVDDTVTITVTQDGEELAEDLVALALAAMRDQDWDTAYSLFSQAVDADPTNGTAVLGYSLHSVAAVSVDEAMVGFAKTNMGLVGYPETMAELFTDAWMDAETVPGEFGYDFVFPEVSGQDDYDLNENDVIEPEERAIAMLSFFIAANPTGLGTSVDTVEAILTAKLADVLTAIDGIPADAQITLTWDMFFDSESDAEDFWPKYETDEFVEFVIGKEEVLVLGAALQVFEHMFYMLQVYDLTLPLDEYWDTFYTDYMDDGTIDDGFPANPFKGSFLAPSDDSTEALQSAAGALEGALTDLSTALDSAVARSTGDGFTFGPGSAFLTAGEVSWSEITPILEFESTFATKVKSSLTGNTMGYFPNFVDAYEFDGPTEFVQEKLAAWPTAANPDNAFGFNFGAFYADERLAIASLLELQTTNAVTSDDVGEPVFYAYGGGSTFSEVIGAPADLIGDPFYFLKIKDVSLGGSINLASFPIDDPDTRYDEYIDTYLYDESIEQNGQWDYVDVEPFGTYTAGDSVEGIEVSVWLQIEGLIERSAISGDYGDDLQTYLDVTPSEIEADLVSASEIPDGATAAFLVSYLLHEDGENSYDLGYGPVAILNADKSVFMGSAIAPDVAMMAMHSLTNEDTSLDYDGDEIEDAVSTGSFWWAPFEM